MTMTQWAENEIKLALAENDKRSKGEEIDFRGYIAGCYQSALKAYKCMSEDGHSSMSWGITVRILEDLMEEIPLTPIKEDEDGLWSMMMNDTAYKEKKDGTYTFQCTRRFSLFKDVKIENGVEKILGYHDNDTTACDDVEADGHIISCGSIFADYFIKQYLGYELKFPYMPNRFRYRVRRVEVGTDEQGNEIYYIPFVKDPKMQIIWFRKYFRWEFGKRLITEIPEADLPPHLKVSADMKAKAEARV